MAKERLQEIIQGTIKVLHEATKQNGGTMNILAPFGRVGDKDNKNKNGRYYEKKLLDREIEKLESSIARGALVGTGDHPKSGNANIETASHIIRKAWITSSGKGMCELSILPTTRGKNIQELIKGGAELGLSMRGFGDVAEDGKVEDNYSFQGIDICINPSEPIATFSQKNLFESVDFEDKKDNEGTERVKAAIEKTAKCEKDMYELLKVIFDEKKIKGYSKTWEQFLEEHEARAREKFNLSPKEKKVEETKAPVVMKRTKPSDYIWEGMMTGLSAVELAKRHNKVVDIQEARAKFSNESTENEGRLYRMFLEAGLSPEDAMKRVEEQRGKPKIKASLSEEEKNLQKEARKLSDESSYSYTEALAVLKKTMKELKEDKINMGAQSLQNILAGKGHANARGIIEE